LTGLRLSAQSKPRLDRNVGIRPIKALRPIKAPVPVQAGIRLIGPAQHAQIRCDKLVFVDVRPPLVWRCVGAVGVA